MVLADLGADVIRVDRPPPRLRDPADAPRYDVLRRGRRSVAVDLKAPGGAEVVLRLVEQRRRTPRGLPARGGRAPGHRPGRLPAAQPAARLRPDDRMGPGGPLADAAGHDLTYVAVAGALAHIGRAGELPDATAQPGRRLRWRRDAARPRGSWPASSTPSARARARWSTQRWSTAPRCSWRRSTGPSAMGFWSDERGTNLLDSGAPFYDVYRCADGAELAVGAIEPQFFAALARGAGARPAAAPAQNDRDRWPELRAALTGAFATRPSRVAGPRRGPRRLPGPGPHDARGRRPPPHRPRGAPWSRSTACRSPPPPPASRPPLPRWIAHPRWPGSTPTRSSVPPASPPTEIAALRRQRRDRSAASGAILVLEALDGLQHRHRLHPVLLHQLVTQWVK